MSPPAATTPAAPPWMLASSRRFTAAQVDAVFAAIAAHYGVAMADMKGHTHRREIAWARHVAISIASELSGLADPALAAHLQHERSGIGYARRRVQDTCDAYPVLREDLTALRLAIAAKLNL